MTSSVHRVALTALAAALAIPSALQARQVTFLPQSPPWAAASERIMAMSRDGSTVATSGLYRLQPGEGGGWGAAFVFPPRLWRASHGSYVAYDVPWVTGVPASINADGTIVGGGGNRTFELHVISAIAWNRPIGAPTGTSLALQPPIGFGEQGDSLKWLSPDGAIGIGTTRGFQYRLTRWNNPASASGVIAMYPLRDGSYATGAANAADQIVCLRPMASDDGRIITAVDWTSGPFRWEEGTGHGLVPLPSVPGATWHDIRCISADGNTIVGTAFGAGDIQNLIRWRTAPSTGVTTAQVLVGPSPAAPDIEGTPLSPSIDGMTACMTPDAAIIGYNIYVEGQGTDRTPMLWFESGPWGQPAASGIGRTMRLDDYLAAHGINLAGANFGVPGSSGLILTEIVAISGDARTFAGHGLVIEPNIEAPEAGPIEITWVISIPTPCTRADVAGLGGFPGADGQLTADDLVFYLSAFFAGDLAIADLTGPGGDGPADGALTSDDLVMFLNFFFAGCD